MAPPTIRPTFEFGADLDPDTLMEGLRRRLPQCPLCTGVSVGRHAELFIPESERKVWSPWLSVTARRTDRGTVVRGRFAPHPSIWTLYLFLAFGLGFFLLVGLTWAYAQWAMETTPWALASAALVFAMGSALYGVSVLGQRLGGSQMVQLKTALEALVAHQSSPQPPVKYEA